MFKLSRNSISGFVVPYMNKVGWSLGKSINNTVASRFSLGIGGGVSMDTRLQFELISTLWVFDYA